METLSKKEIIEILKDDSINEALLAKADSVRKKYTGDEVHLRALIEFSNICRCKCKYCGIRAENNKVARYRLSDLEIVKTAENAVAQGYKTIVLQSGEDMYFTADRLCEIIKKIKTYDTAVTLSIGERSRDEYKMFKDAGADRYLIRIETTDRNLYKKMHPDMSFDNRLRCLKDLKDLGYETGTGCLVGLPEQTVESLADDILFFKEINADMIGIGPFIPHPDTPLKNADSGNFILALKVMALTRILLKNINIPATTAMETIYENGRNIALQSGANVIMPNVTLSDYCKKYEIYPDKHFSGSRKKIAEELKLLGRTISKDYGFRKYL